MLHLFVSQVYTYIRVKAFQSASEIFITENILPFKDEVTVDLSNLRNYSMFISGFPHKITSGSLMRLE